jgi:hypothetical protein
MGLGRVISNLFTHLNLHQTNQQVGLYNVGAPLVLKWAMGDLRFTRVTMARTWGKPSPSPILYTLHLSMRPTSKWFFVPGFPKVNLETTKVRTPATLRGYNSCLDLRLGWGLQQSCSFFQELSNSMSHATCTHRVGSIPDVLWFGLGFRVCNLTPDISFCHNLCYKYPNGHTSPF